jgi:hypothetical protein
VPPVLEVALTMITHSETCEKRPLQCCLRMSRAFLGKSSFGTQNSGAKLLVVVFPTKPAKVVRRNTNDILDVLTNILDPLFHKLGELLFLLQIYM